MYFIFICTLNVFKSYKNFKCLIYRSTLYVFDIYKYSECISYSKVTYKYLIFISTVYFIFRCWPRQHFPLGLAIDSTYGFIDRFGDLFLFSYENFPLTLLCMSLALACRRCVCVRVCVVHWHPQTPIDSYIKDQIQIQVSSGPRVTHSAVQPIGNFGQRSVPQASSLPACCCCHCCCCSALWLCAAVSGSGSASEAHEKWCSVNK